MRSIMEYVFTQAQITAAVINLLKAQDVVLAGKKVGINFSINKAAGGLNAKVTIEDKAVAAVPAVEQVVEAPALETPAPVNPWDAIDEAAYPDPVGTANHDPEPPKLSGALPVKNIFQEHAERTALKAGQTLDAVGRVVEPDPEPTPGADGEVLLAGTQKLGTQGPRISLFGNK